MHITPRNSLCVNAPLETDTSSNDISLRGVINQTTDVSLRDLLGQLI